MLMLWAFLFTAASAHKVFESTEDIGPEAFQNITALYPITTTPATTNITNTNPIKNDDKDVIDDSNNDVIKHKIRDKATSWKIEAAFAESNLDQDKENGTDPKVVEDNTNSSKEFRPSQHLGTFYDEDNALATPTRSSEGLFLPIKKPSSGFTSSVKEDYHSGFTKIPKQIFETHKQYPYKFESPVLTRLKDPWRGRPDILESKPTAEIPVKVPAGGLYKYSDPFGENPGHEQNEDSGLEFNDDGKNSVGAVKKREHPWEGLLRLLTAFLPVGLIISALTPSIITIDTTGPGTGGFAAPGSGGVGGLTNPYQPNIFRRSDHQAAHLPAISERCRRRLLCELHSDDNYKPTQSSSHRRRKQCHKIPCGDPNALARTLQYLLAYRNGHYT